MRDPQLRARDQDRDAAIEQIEAAYVDGEITSVDRDLRVGNALKASTLGELAMITRDLQTQTQTPAPAEAPRPPLRPRRLVIPVVVMSVVAVGVVLAFNAFGSDDPPESSTEQVVQPPDQPSPDQPSPGQQSPDQEEPADGFTMTPAGMRAFVAAYEDQFGTSDVLEATFYADDRVILMVPTRGNSNRHERWSYKDEFTQDEGATTNASGEQPIDLRDLNVTALFENIQKAKRVLNVDHGELTHVNLTSTFEDVPVANIYVSNDFQESGYLRTALNGKVIRAYPF
jgi:hypothetical protein